MRVFHVVDHLVVNHVPTVGLFLVLLHSLQDNVHIVNRRVAWVWQVYFVVLLHELGGSVDVVAYRFVPDGLPSYGLPLDERDGVTGKEVVPGLQWGMWHARVCA